MSTGNGLPLQHFPLIEIADAMPVSMFIANSDGLLTYTNSRVREITGLRADALAGVGWLEAVHPDERPMVEHVWRDAVATGEPFEAEFRITCRDGSHIWTLTRAAPVRRDGKVDHWLGTATEISDRKYAEELLADKERWFRSTFENAAVGVAHVSPSGRFLAVNDRLCELLQRSRADLLATNFQSVTYPGDILENEDNVARILRGDIDHYAMEKRYVLPDGSTFWSSLKVGLKRDEAGFPHHLVVLVEDITAHKARYDRLEQTLTKLSALNWEWNPLTGQVSYAGDTKKLLGFTPKSANEFIAAVHPDDQAVLLDLGDAFTSGEEKCDLTFRFVRPDGGIRWLCCEAHMLLAGGKQLLTGFLRDVTEDKAARDLLHEQAERLRLAFTASDTAAWDWDVQTNKVVWAGGLAERLGLAKEGFGGSFDAFWDLVIDEDKPLLADALGAALSGQRDYEVEFRMRRADGTIRWTTTKAVVVRDEAGKPTRMVGVDADITTRKEAEEALRQQSKVLNTVLATTTDRVKVIERDGSLSYMNSSGRRSFGLSEDESLEAQCWADFWPEDQQKLINSAVAAGNQGIPSRFHARDAGAYGTNRWWDVSVIPSVGTNGEVSQLVAVARDITPAKEHELEVEALAQRAELALGAAGSFVYEFSPLNGSVYRSPSTLSVLGYRPDEIEPTRQGWLAVIHRDDRQRFDMEFDKAARTMSSYAISYRAVRKDGEIIAVTDVGRIFYDERGNIEKFIGCVTDVTAWSNAEKALADSEARFRAITEAMPQIVWSAQPNGEHDYFNSRWYDFTGVPVGSTHGVGWRELFHPEDRARIDELWGNSLKTGRPYEIEYRLRSKDGTYHWVLGRALPVRGTNNEIIKWMGTCTDIDEVVRIRKALQVAVETKDSLLAEVNHRVKNSFQLVSSLLMLQARTIEDLGARQVLHEADRRIRTLASLHADLYQHSNHGEVEIFSHLGKLFANTVTAYADARIKANVHAEGKLSLNLDVAIPLSMIVAELATNSIKYAFPNGAAGVMSLKILSEEGSLLIHLADNGIGLPPGFTFASSKGLGMRIIQALARQVAAKLTIDTDRPGAAFTIAVPL